MITSEILYDWRLQIFDYLNGTLTWTHVQVSTWTNPYPVTQITKEIFTHLQLAQATCDNLDEMLSEYGEIGDNFTLRLAGITVNVLRLKPHDSKAKREAWDLLDRDLRDFMKLSEFYNIAFKGKEPLRPRSVIVESGDITVSEEADMRIELGLRDAYASFKAYTELLEQIDNAGQKKPETTGKKFDPEGEQKIYAPTPEGLQLLLSSSGGEKEHLLAQQQAVLCMYIRADRESCTVDQAKIAACLGLESESDCKRLSEGFHRKKKSEPSPPVERPGKSGKWNQVQVNKFLQRGVIGQDIRELVENFDCRDFSK